MNRWNIPDCLESEVIEGYSPGTPGLRINRVLRVMLHAPELGGGGRR
jgi:hypothetical protein